MKSLFKNPIFSKTTVIFLLIILMMIPLSLIKEVIQERSSYRKDVHQELAQTFAGSQTFIGPIMIVPYSVTKLEASQDDKGNTVMIKNTYAHQKIIYPDILQIDKSQLSVSTKKRNIYEVLLFEWQPKIHAKFTPPSLQALRQQIQNQYSTDVIELHQPLMSLSVSDLRGFVKIPVGTLQRGDRPPEQLQWQQNNADLRVSNLPPSLITPITLEANKQQPFDIQLEFALAGISQLNIIPIGQQNSIQMTSTWPHPKFMGAFLPRKSHITPQGFTSMWEVSSLASRAQQTFNAQIDEGKNIEPEQIQSITIDVIDPVDIYTQADRAVKYGVLFILLTFVVMFILEFTQNLAVHPMQYLLIGLALAVFFLLLVSTSEYLNFSTAYLIATTACISILMIYLAAIVKKKSQLFGLFAFFVLLYTVLYVLLQASTYTFLLGSIVIFIALATTMLLTRQVDWYQLSRHEPRMQSPASNRTETS